MPITASIDEAARLVTIRYAGDPTFEEFTKVMLAVFGDARYRPGFSFLADRRAAAAPSADYLHSVTAFMRIYEANVIGSRWATVVSSEVAYGMARMGLRLNEQSPVELAVFTGVDEALGWLHRNAGARET
jgi:hypothetical protein